MTEEVKQGLYQIKIPFEDIYTSAFVLTNGSDAVILDCGANACDAEQYVIPAISALELNPVYIAVSHDHGDHCGGKEALKNAYPGAKLVAFLDESVNDGDVLLDRFMPLNLKGHCNDSLAMLDLTTKTLFSCDCLQMYGVSKYGGNFDDYMAYLASLNRIRNLNVNTIIASHDFVPYGTIAEGEAEVNRYLDECERVVNETVEFTKRYSDKECAEIAVLFNEEHKGIPPVSTTTIKNIRLKGLLR